MGERRRNNKQEGEDKDNDLRSWGYGRIQEWKQNEHLNMVEK